MWILINAHQPELPTSVACQSGSRARMAQAGSAGPCLRQHLLSPTVYTSCIVRLLITHLMHLSISIQPMCYTVKLHAMLYSEASHSGTLMYGSEGSNSGTLMYGSEGSHSGTLMYCSDGSHSGTLMYGSEGSHSGTLMYCSDASHSGTLVKGAILAR